MLHSSSKFTREAKSFDETELVLKNSDEHRNDANPMNRIVSG